MISKCVKYCSLIIVILVLCLIFLSIILVFFVINYIKNIKYNILKTYKIDLVNYCKNLPPIKYSSIITFPIDPYLYEYSLAKSLLDVSLFVTQSTCLNIVPIPNPPGFNTQYRLIGVDPFDGKDRMFATVFSNSYDKRCRKHTILTIKWINTY